MNKEKETITTENTTTIVATKKEYVAHVKAIKKELQGIEKSFIRTALMLHWIDETQAYSYGEYLNGVEMAKNEFGLSKSTYYNFINIVKDFGLIDVNTGLCDELKPEYVNYSSTQLIAMHGCTDEELACINSNMTVKDIKAIIQSKRSNLIGDSEEMEEEETEEESTETKKKNTSLDTSPVQSNNSQSLISIKSVEELESKKDELLSIIRKILEQGEQYSVSINMLW